MRALTATLLASSALALAVGPAHAQTAIAPYTLSVFATAPAGLSAPDSLAVIGQNVFVGYGDGHKPDGSDGLNSQIVEYNAAGKALRTFSVPGHNDGLKADPSTHRLWALQNEDGNSNLVIIDLHDMHERKLAFTQFPHGGGYDDMVFLRCKVLISASNPANNPNTAPAIVSVTLGAGSVNVSPFLMANAQATDIPTGAVGTLNLQDPDSMTLDPLGDIVLDSQADQELIVVSHPGGANQRVLHLPLTYQTATGPMPVEVDDTNFATSSQGFILFSDKGANTIYRLDKAAWAPGAAYTSADGGPFVGTLDMSTGVIAPIVTGVKAPGGLIFVDTSMPHPAEPENHCE